MARIVVVVLLVVCVACSSTAPTTAGPTSSTDTTAPDATSTPGFPIGVYGAQFSPVQAGMGYLEFAADGTGSVHADDTRGDHSVGIVKIPFAYTATDDEVTFTSTDDIAWTSYWAFDTCDPDAAGTYRWSFEDNVLDLAESFTDPCPARATTITGLGHDQHWNWLGDVPIMLAEPSDTPVTVTTAVGDITWHVVQGQPYLSGVNSWAPGDGDPVAFGNGFAALIARYPGVVTSSDGMTWDPMPPPPTPPRLLTVRGDELYVLDYGSPSRVYVTTDLGTTWTPLAFNPPQNSNIRGFHPGPAGVLIVTGDASRRQTSLWVLETDTFELVESAPSPMRTILALDSGFFATDQSGWVSEDGRTWTSQDGRTWTELTGFRGDLVLGSPFGDNVYGATSDGQGVTSTDGGRTWSEPTPRPGGGWYGSFMTVGDAGYFTIDNETGVVWASTDDLTWERVLNTIPIAFMNPPVLNDNTILITGISMFGRDVDWVGVIE